MHPYAFPSYNFLVIKGQSLDGASELITYP